MLHTPVTSAPRLLAIWTANGPTLPDAPTISTLSPAPDGAATEAQALQRKDRRVREGRRLLERHPAPDRRERALADADELRERPLPVHEQVAEHIVARPEAGRAGPDLLDHPRDVGAEAVVSRPAEAQERAG